MIDYNFLWNYINTIYIYIHTQKSFILILIFYNIQEYNIRQYKIFISFSWLSYNINIKIYMRILIFFTTYNNDDVNQDINVVVFNI